MLRIIVALSLVVGVWGQERVLSPANARVEAVVEKTGVMSGKKHLLRWEKFTGQFTVTPPMVRFEADASSVAVLDDWVTAGQKDDIRKETVGKNVLDAARHPVIRFVSTGANSETIQGDLTVRGVTKPVTLRIKKNADGAYEGESAFLMSLFGIKPPKAALGFVGTKDLMTIRVTVTDKERKEAGQ